MACLLLIPSPADVVPDEASDSSLASSADDCLARLAAAEIYLKETMSWLGWSLISFSEERL